MNINPIKSPYFEWYDYVAYFLLSYQLGLRYINQFTKATVVARHAANSPHNVHGQRSPSRAPPHTQQPLPSCGEVRGLACPLADP